MSDTPDLDTAQLHAYILRWQQGDRAAADELLMGCVKRLEHLARRMLKGYPAIRGHTETPDVLQGCLIRLLAALRSVRPRSTRDFYNLAAVQVRRELIDLGRHFSCRPTVPLGDDLGGSEGGKPMVDERETPLEDLEMWCRFHQEVETLPVEQREVVSLAVYHGRTHLQIAEILDVDERSVRRYWRTAIMKLGQSLDGRLPGL